MAIEQITYKNIDPKSRKLIMLGLILAMLTACFDGTIVGTCGPTIVLDLHGSALYSWMITIYLLCETVMIPVAGKLSDLYGRKPLFLIGLTVFTLGSVLTGLSSSMEMFIVGRGIQGLGGGILIPVATAAVADLYAPHERGRMQGLLGAVFGIGSGIGPLIGGYITENISWHWCFFMNLPLAIVAFILTMQKFPTPEQEEKPSIDYLGIAVLSAFLIDILLLFQWGGNDFEWVSMETFGMVAVAIVLMVIFVFLENRAKEPILSPKLIHNRTVVMAAVFMFIFGLGMMGAMTYSSMFAVTILMGGDTLKAAEYSLFMVAGMMITAIGSGHLLNRTGYKIWLIVGPLVTAFSMYLMSNLTLDSTLEYYAICLFLLGLGLGCMMAVVMTAVQNSSTVRDMGMTTSAVNLIRSVGATIGTAIFAVLIGSKINQELYDNVSQIVYDNVSHSVGVLDDMFAALQKVAEGTASLIDYAIAGDAQNILLSFANSVDFAFLCGMFIILLQVVIGIFFKVTPVEEDNEIYTGSTDLALPSEEASEESPEEETKE
jgi:EmrB/QacA subfamily drug resistance transporter